MGIISKSVAHTCLLVQGAYGDFSNLMTNSTVGGGHLHFYRGHQEKPGIYVTNSGYQLGFRASTRSEQRSLEKQRTGVGTGTGGMWLDCRQWLRAAGLLGLW